MNKVTASLLMSGVASLSAYALAHGDVKPQYGGIVQSVSDIAYELVPHDLGLILYVEDHGNPVPTAGIGGKLVLTQGPNRRETELRSIGENKMLAKDARVRQGERPTVILMMPSGRSIVIQFPAK